MNTFWGDPTIYLVYSKNIAKGDFFSFNPQTFSSGSTSPLWALILSISFLFDNPQLHFYLRDDARHLLGLRATSQHKKSNCKMKFKLIQW